MRNPSALFMALLSIGSFIFTYNFVSIIVTSNEKQSKFVMDPLVEMPEHVKRSRNHRRPFHVALTATATPYSKWQCRIMYYWYNEKKDLPGSNMGKLTRILHSGAPDNLMDEIPTVVVDPLPLGLDRGYVVLNRPWAFVQWLEKSTIEEEYILMAEPDHIFLKPLPNLAYGDYPVAYPFFYIKPVENESLIRKFFPEAMGPVSNVDPIGNSPVIIKKELLKKIAPTWLNVSLKMKNDPETDRKFGWVLEMYGYAVASALHRVQHILRNDFILQPPYDMETQNKFILHYTYACDFNLKGELIYPKVGEWRFDKRAYLDAPPPRNLPLPPRGVPESVVTLVRLLNEATAKLPNWPTAEEVNSSRIGRS
ncbi:hypothetical protein SASPL_118358 [Salvia splendens]|uniref:Hydroxyproline O-arabinosyltransferase-like domain-containing protein n=1 Tax=Salvia splendens TaxID=180675 RepID=A0A8X8Y277_SALSN|nr:hydroxyproline O-arabinosyltransferase RDN2-like [Salvia splendens]KAG6421801.1 hypothetical protein SASPL_118358 [Salvia splendens]